LGKVYKLGNTKLLNRNNNKIRSMKIMELTTKIDSPNSNSKSLRSVIPREIINFLNLEKGDSLNWVVEAEDNDFKISLKKSE
jgi:hypothetical protein